MIGLIIVIMLFMTAVLVPWLAPASPVETILDRRLLPPSKDFWFGTDELGRDIYTRVIHGSRITLYVVVVVGAIVVPIGILFGIVAGYFGGWIDQVLMRITDICMAFPRLVLALAFVAAIGPGIKNAVLAISITTWPPFARIVRAETLTVRNSDYILAARQQGASAVRILLNHILPMCISSVIIRLTLDMARIILVAAGLGFLGMGAQPPAPEWGSMVSTGREFLFDFWWVATIPGIAILVVSLGFNLLGDGLRDVLDPKHGS
jgi:peptide/nickel transport system permease protein